MPFRIRILLGGKDNNLDQWFETAERTETIPSFEELWHKAQILFQCYGHAHAFETALTGRFFDDDRTIPSGDPWTETLRDMSSVHLGFENKKGKGKQKRKKEKLTENESDDEAPPFLGDQTLAQSCRFMYDATVSREVIYATADGDIGRVWEAVKVCKVRLLNFNNH
jgi:hypothetical protein